MKKLIFTLAFASALTGVNAQTQNKTASQDFKKWSIELAGGINNAQSAYTLGSPIAGINLLTVDLGVRYMINNIFGIKADAGYNRFKKGDVVTSSVDTYNSRYYRLDLQGVANVGKLLNFKTFTSKLGLLAHTGVGMGAVRSGDLNDLTPNLIYGLTGQYKLSNKFALTLDASNIMNKHQTYAFDFRSNANENGSLLNMTLGLTYYIGKGENHADWVNFKDEAVGSLEKRVADLETMNNDSDKDGVVDYLDTEPNTITGLLVDSKGRAIDLNKNSVPDELEKYLDRYALKGDSPSVSGSPITTQEDVVKQFINQGYVNLYYDFNQSTPISSSTNQIGYILTYLRNNPSTSVDIIGYADEIGNSDYNKQLSKSRAEKVKETLVKAQINPSRLNIRSLGEDNSVNVNSEEARKLVRRVTFKVN